MSIDITKIAQQYTSPLGTMGGADSAVRNLLAEQERWRKQLLGPSSAMRTIQAHLAEQEHFTRQYRKLAASPSLYAVSELIERTLNTVRLMDTLAPAKAFLDQIEQNRRLVNQMARLSDPLREIADRITLDQVSLRVSEMTSASEYIRRILESLPDPTHADDAVDWDALDGHLEGVQATIEHLPLTGASPHQFHAMGFSRAEWITVFFSLLSLMLGVLAYLETRAQGRFSRDQAAEEQARSQQEVREEKEYRERLLAAIEALAEHAPSQVDYYVVGLRSVRVKSSITKGALIDTAHPNQIVLATGKNGRWLKIRYRNNLEDREVEGWVLKHYLIRQTGPGDDGAQE